MDTEQLSVLVESTSRRVKAHKWRCHMQSYHGQDETVWTRKHVEKMQLSLKLDVLMVMVTVWNFL